MPSFKAEQRFNLTQVHCLWPRVEAPPGSCRCLSCMTVVYLQQAHIVSFVPQWNLMTCSKLMILLQV
jgi:hypothetical protein